MRNLRGQIYAIYALTLFMFLMSFLHPTQGPTGPIDGFPYMSIGWLGMFTGFALQSIEKRLIDLEKKQKEEGEIK